MRLFVAIVLEPRVRLALETLQREIGRRISGVRWIPPNQLHLTVKFLGEVGDGDVPGVCEAVAQATSASSPFAMTVASTGCFPTRGDVRIVWAGVKEQSGELLRCVERIEAALEDQGFARERRPFSAHITIGRVKADRSGGAMRARVEGATLHPMDQPVQHVVVMSSDLTPQGPRYAVISETRLGKETQSDH